MVSLKVSATFMVVRLKKKIIALKQIGFSLEEIHQNLAEDKDVDITEALTRQLDILEGKKYEIEKAKEEALKIVSQTKAQAYSLLDEMENKN